MKNDSCNFDFGGEPYAVNISRLTRMNRDYRKAIWTGKHLQLTVMSIAVNGEIGLEVHMDTDQFLRIESGFGVVKMGSSKKSLDYRKKVFGGCAVFVPAGIWHNIVNVGNVPIKLYSIYAPAHHEKGIVQKFKSDDV